MQLRVSQTREFYLEWARETGSATLSTFQQQLKDGRMTVNDNYFCRTVISLGELYGRNAVETACSFLTRDGGSVPLRLIRKYARDKESFQQEPERMPWDAERCRGFTRGMSEFSASSPEDWQQPVADPEDREERNM